MAEFTLKPYRIQVDVEATRAYYAAHPQHWITCDCAGCRNFARAVRGLPQAVRDFFDDLGLDPEKPEELCYYTGTPNILIGGGWYHLVGHVQEGASKPGGCEVFPGWYELSEDFSVGFKTSCDLLPDDFPRPCFQMEFNHRLPWVLEELNPYID